MLSGIVLSISVIRPVKSGGMFTGQISLVGGMVWFDGAVEEVVVPVAWDEGLVEVCNPVVCSPLFVQPGRQAVKTNNRPAII